jgi:hypothetical protein
VQLFQVRPSTLRTPVLSSVDRFLVFLGFADERKISNPRQIRMAINEEEHPHLTDTIQKVHEEDEVEHENPIG